jgi:hypothetical protein
MALNTEKVKLTTEGGIAILLTNKTGVNSVQGQIVIASTGTANSFATAAANEDMPIGAVYNAGVADGSECWVVVAGIADVLVDAAGAALGNVLYCGATGGSATAAAALPAVANHNREVGHGLEARANAGLIKAILHWN